MDKKSSLILSVIMLTVSLSLPALAQTLYDQCETLRSEGEPKAATQKQLAALKDKDAQARKQAMAQLAESCDKRAVEPLLALLNDPDPTIRAAAVATLGRLGDRDSIDPLLELLEKEKDWTVRDAYATSLASFQIHRASYAVLNTIANPQTMKVTDETELRTRCHAILLVNQLRDVKFSRKAVGFLFTFLSYPEEPLRRIAEETMYALKDTRNGKHELTGILRQSNFPEFQIKAATWLGRLGIEDSRELLTEMIAPGSKQLNPLVVQAIKDAIAMLDKKQAATK